MHYTSQISVTFTNNGESDSAHKNGSTVVIVDPSSAL